VVLTRTLALKYYGTIDCVGENIEVDHVHIARVTGVVEDPPSNATESFRVLLSSKTSYSPLAIADAHPPAAGELSIIGRTFVRLRPGTNVTEMIARLSSRRTCSTGEGGNFIAALLGRYAVRGCAQPQPALKSHVRREHQHEGRACSTPCLERAAPRHARLDGE